MPFIIVEFLIEIIQLINLLTNLFTASWTRYITSDEKLFVLRQISFCSILISSSPLPRWTMMNQMITCSYKLFWSYYSCLPELRLLKTNFVFVQNILKPWIIKWEKQNKKYKKISLESLILYFRQIFSKNKL